MRINDKKLSIIIPVFNEEKTIQKIIELVFKVDILGLEREVIVVNDGSTDLTKKILTNLKNDFNFVLINLEKNQGKGMAIRKGLKYVKGDLVIIQDADFEYDPNDYKNLLKEISNDFPVIYGSRNIKKKRNIGYFHYYLGSKILNILINILFKTNLTDAYTCYKLFPLDLIRNIEINSNGFEFEAEITVKILKMGIKIKEIPINYYPRTFKQGKKITIKDALIGMIVILENRFIS